MQGQVLFRATGQKSKTGKKVFVVIGVVGIDENEIGIEDGFKYDLFDMSVFNGKDFTELNNSLSPEDLLEQKIWVVK